MVNTTGKTEFRRFAGDSVKYEDAKPGTLAQIQMKDQLQARGAKSADGLRSQAEEVMSGSFLNLSGLIASIDPAAGKITLKDLATKKMMTVDVTANCDIRNMPLLMATLLRRRQWRRAGRWTRRRWTCGAAQGRMAVRAAGQGDAAGACGARLERTCRR